ncbi:MAG: IS30 family transposase [Clostridia bacterium]|nr:IS30 family transposase [Clostridia bacterium]
MMSYKHFTLKERECLSEKIKEGKSIRQIAKEMKRSPSTISREIKRNTTSDDKGYYPLTATSNYINRRKNSVRPHIIGNNPSIDEFVIECLNKYWSPEIIAVKSKKNKTPVSCSTIYRAIKEKRLPKISEQTHLRRRGKLKYQHRKTCQAIHPDHTIHERPKSCEQKLRFGDWEGDTVLGGKGKGCIVTLVDRKSKVLSAAISCKMSASSIRAAINQAFEKMSVSLPIRTLTLDRGSEFADFRNIEKDLNTTIYFADPHAPWQRGLNENTNDMLRFFFPKGYDFLSLSDEELQNVVYLINCRPRKCLNYLSPLEFISKKCCT